MTGFPTHTIDTAPEASKPTLERVKAASASGFVPNLIGTTAEAPAMVEGYVTLSGIFNKTDLSETERQIILLTNNRLDGCTYCMAAHMTASQLAKVRTDVKEALRNNTPIADPKHEALRTFTAVINETRGWPTQAQVDAFLAAGYTRQTVLEVIVGTSLTVLSNYTNHFARCKDAEECHHKLDFWRGRMA